MTIKIVNEDDNLPPHQKHPNKEMAKETDVQISAVELSSSVKIKRNLN